MRLHRAGINLLTKHSQEKIPYFILTLAVFTVYMNVYVNNFVYDDFYMIASNTLLQHWQTLPALLSQSVLAGFDTSLAGSGFHRPVQMLLYFLVYQLFSASAPAFHGLNVALHALNACLVYKLGKRLHFHQLASLAAALLWSIHPLLTETVAYASSTAEILVSLFTMAGLLALLPDFSPRRILISGAFFLLAVGSKESGVVFPVLAAATFFLTSRDRRKVAAYYRLWPLALIAMIYTCAWLLPHYVGMHDPEDLVYNQLYAGNIFNRIFTSLATLPAYAGLMVWPAHLYIERSFVIFTSLFAPQVLAGAVLVIGAMAQIIWGKGRHGLALSWGILWFAAAHFPTTGIVKPIDGFISEGWMYFPTIGLFLGAAQTVVVWIEKLHSKNISAIGAGLMIVAALSLGAKTYLQNSVWHDHLSLFENAAQNGSDSGRTQAFLGIEYFQQRDYTKAGEHLHAFFAHPAPVWQAKTSYMHYRLALIDLNLLPDANGAVIVRDMRHAMATASPEAIDELRATVETAPANDAEANYAQEMLAIAQK